MGRETAHGYTAYIGDGSHGQGEVKSGRRLGRVPALAAVQFKEVPHLIQHYTIRAALLDRIVAVPKSAAGRPRLWGGDALRCCVLFAGGFPQNGDDFMVFVILREEVQHTAVTVPNILTLGEYPAIRHDNGELDFIIA